MHHMPITPQIRVTIGQQSRRYFAFVTTAPASIDSPATVTLHAGTFSDLVGFAPDAIEDDKTCGRTLARLVLIDAMELAWQRAKYAGHDHVVLAADPGRFGLNTLQHWLWQRLHTPMATPVAA